MAALYYETKIVVFILHCISYHCHFFPEYCVAVWEI